MQCLHFLKHLKFFFFCCINFTAIWKLFSLIRAFAENRLVKYLNFQTRKIQYFYKIAFRQTNCETILQHRYINSVVARPSLKLIFLVWITLFALKRSLNGSDRSDFVVFSDWLKSMNYKKALWKFSKIYAWKLQNILKFEKCHWHFSIS